MSEFKFLGLALQILLGLFKYAVFLNGFFFEHCELSLGFPHGLLVLELEVFDPAFLLVDERLRIVHLFDAAVLDCVVFLSLQFEMFLQLVLAERQRVYLLLLSE